MHFAMYAFKNNAVACLLTSDASRLHSGISEVSSFLYINSIELKKENYLSPRVLRHNKSLRNSFVGLSHFKNGKSFVKKQFFQWK